MRRIKPSELTSQPEPLFKSNTEEPLKQALAGHEAHARALGQAQDDVVEIARRAVKAVVREELALRPEHIRAIVSELLQEVRSARRISVHVHPSDRERLPGEAELAEESETRGVIELISDPSLTPGDCVVSSERGQIDARIETKLSQLMALLSLGRSV